MKEWKVIIEQNNIRSEIVISEERYSDAYINTLIKHPDCKVVSISEFHPE